MPLRWVQSFAVGPVGAVWLNAEKRTAHGIKSTMGTAALLYERVLPGGCWRCGLDHISPPFMSPLGTHILPLSR